MPREGRKERERKKREAASAVFFSSTSFFLYIYINETFVVVEVGFVAVAAIVIITRVLTSAP